VAHEEAEMTITKARNSVVASFLLTSIVGVVFLLVHWWSEGVGIAIWTSVLFVVIAGSMHGAGYLLYVQQFEPKPAVAPLPVGKRFSPLYWPAIRFGGVLQVVLGFLTASLLDGGRAFGFFQVAFVAYWLIVGLIIVRRPQSPTRGDIVFIRWGIVFTLFVSGNCAPFVWRIIGESDLSGWQRLMGR
jgi:hypothetical protein